MQVAEILNMIPEDLTDKLSEDSHVDHSVQRLRGRVMLELLLFGMVRSERLSTRILEELYNAPLFGYFSSKDPEHQTRHSSLADRLKTIPSEYFKEIFEWAFQAWFTRYGGDKLLKKMVRFDSTMIKISSALVDWGMRVGRPPKDSPAQVQFKVSIGLKGLFPKIAQVHTAQAYLSEEKALKALILQASPEPDELVSFDRGLKSRNTMQEFDHQDIRFVTRGAENLRYQVIEKTKELPAERDGLRFLQDSKIYLYTDGHQLFEHPFRLVEVLDTTQDKRLYFISNIFGMGAEMIADVYRHRWDIETFFRFLKQELNMKHLLSHSLNGIEVQLYVAMLLAILLTVFKTTNQLKGYKIPKLRFEQQLLHHIIVQLKTGEKLVKQQEYPVP